VIDHLGKGLEAILTADWFIAQRISQSRDLTSHDLAACPIWQTCRKGAFGMSGLTAGLVALCGRAAASGRRRCAAVVLACLLTGCAGSRSNDPGHLLADADDLVMRNNWPRAVPLFARAERLLRQSADQRDAPCARVGYIWVTAETGWTGGSGDTDVDRALPYALSHHDQALRLRCLVAQAVREREANEAAARQLWE